MMDGAEEQTTGTEKAPPIERLDAATPDLAQQNAEKIAALFPEVVTEGPEGDGPHIDFDLLRQALSNHLVEGPAERYRLDWPGKRQAMLLANTPTTKTLRPVREDSVDFDTTRNLFIEGDNLEALKILQETYLGKVKMIYIDPPYNTGKDFIYRDNFRRSAAEELKASGQADEEGRLVANTEANGRFHSDWLSMMAPRLKLAQSLLRDDGVVFVSIDENEVDNLSSILRQVFGDKSYIGAFPVVTNLKGNQDAYGFAGTHEFIACCVKDQDRTTLGVLDVAADVIEEEWDEDEHGLFKEADNLRATGRNAPREKRPNLWYPIFFDATNERIYATDDDQPLDFTHETVWPVNPKGKELSWYWGKDTLNISTHNLIPKLTKNGRQFYRKQRPSLGDLPTAKPKSTMYKASYSSSTATTNLEALMGDRLFDDPKPLPLIEDLLRIGSGGDGIVIDLFGGSATMAEAAMRATEQEQTVITMQFPEPIEADHAAREHGFGTISELARERIRRAGAKILAETPGLKGTLDVGFRAFRVDSSNFHDTRLTVADAAAVATDDAKRADLLDGLTSHIVDDRSDEDLLFGALLAWGVDITLPVRRETVEGRDVLLVDALADSMEGAALIACFARDVDVDLAAALAALKPLRVVFRDDGFVDDATKENVASRFKQLAPDTALRVL